MKRATFFILMLLASLASHAGIHAIDSLMSIENDSIRLRQMFIYAQNHMDDVTTLALLDSGVSESQRQKHVPWELSFMGSKVRWAHRHHEWDKMDRFLRAQREASFRLGSIGNYMSQIAQSVIVLSGVGMYEQAWKYIEQIKKDVAEAGEDGEKNRAYIYLAEAEYYQKRGETKKCRDTYLYALKDCKNVSVSQRLSIHNGLIMAYTQMGEYKNALMHADSVIALYYTFSVDHQRVPNSRALLVECELNKAGLYMRLGQYDQMRSCIEAAQQASPGISVNNIGDIYYWWHRYYYAVGSYEKSLAALDSAATCLRADHYNELALHRELDKVPSLWAMGQHDRAIRHYTTTLVSLDSLHQSMIAAQQEYLAQMSEMLQQEELQINLKLWASRMLSIVALLSFLIIMGAVAYALYARRKLRDNYHITHRKLQQAREADQAKEQFLHEITSLIGTPLKSVVADVKRLAADTSLTAEQQQSVLQSNKRNVARLMTLVGNVLDLSRLEAGMMKYNATECDLIQLVEEGVRRHNNMCGESQAEIKTEIDSFTLKLDPARFDTMLRTMFSAPVDHPDWKPESLRLQLRRDGDGNVLLVIMGTRYSHDDRTEAEQMTNRINSLFMHDFGASYAVGYGAITIVFPAQKPEA